MINFSEGKTKYFYIHAANERLHDAPIRVGPRQDRPGEWNRFHEIHRSESKTFQQDRFCSARKSQSRAKL